MISPRHRAPALARIRNLKMAQSAHAYVRGSTLKFYEWLEDGAHKVPQGPPVWICGDCHLGNLGPLADKKGRVNVLIRDLDQTVIGNPAHDLLRLGLSLASAARGSDLPGVTTAHILEQMMAGYDEALNGDFERHQDKSYRPRVIQDLLQQSVHRRWRQLAQERLSSRKGTLPLGKKFWPLGAGERSALKTLFTDPQAVATLTGLTADAAAGAKLTDAAYWVKGCSSLGRLRYVALLRIKNDDTSLLRLIDVKEGVTAGVPKAAGQAMPRDNAERVVAGARVLSPHLGDRMIAARLRDKAVIIRELMPQDLKLEVENLTSNQAQILAGYLASVVGRAHGRQMDAAQRKAWSADLRQAQSKTLDAPSWLWSGVVDLLSVHEGAYLEHCRKFAVTERADRERAA